MKKLKNLMFALGLSFLLIPYAHSAGPVDLGVLALNGILTPPDGSIDTANQVDNYLFTVTTLESVELFTASASPFDPRLTLWKSTGTDFQLVSSNDNRATANFFETNNAKDAQIFSQLGPGTYEVSVSEAGNIAAGNFLSNGFTNGGQQSQSFYAYSLELHASAVPLPATIWMFGSVVLGYLGFAKKNRVI
jgi:hypothetical protein